MKSLLKIVFVISAGVLAQSASAEEFMNPKASYIDVAQRRAELAHNSDPRIAAAISSLKSCSKLPSVEAPKGRMASTKNLIC